MKSQEFKEKAAASLECFREEFTTKQLALELYEIYGLQSPVQSWIAHINACFNPRKPEFFHWCDIVNLCRITGQWGPINFMCDELGLEHPKQINMAAKIEQEKALVKKMQAELMEREAALFALIQKTGAGDSEGARFMRAED